MLAATAYVGSLEGLALLDTNRVRGVVRRIASSRSRRYLLAAYTQAAAQARQELGVATVPMPVVIVRAAPVGYRIERFASDSATVSIWRVGVVGSGATGQLAQSWRTDTLSLVWEDDAWKLDAVASAPGPTPPLTSASSASATSDLFTAIPRFEAFARADP